MILNSIKWRLQLWYGLILVVVLAGFGFTAFQLERGRQLRRIDSELQQRVGFVANSIRPAQQGRGRDGRGRMEMETNPPLFDRSTADDPGRGLPRGEIRMPQLPERLFDETDTNGFYYFVLGLDGAQLARSANAPEESLSRPRPMLRDVRLAGENAPPQSLPQGRLRERNPPQTFGGFREIMLSLPRGEMVVVGRSIKLELHELRLTAWWLTAVGGAVLLIGLAGGWWIVTRSMRPVQDISAAATKIAAGDLSQRISVAETEDELGQLASVLNSTFSRLDAAFTQQQQFTSDVAHELRTPVSVMLTQTQTTLNRERNATEYRDTVESCQRAAQRMRRLIESLLELARLDAGQQQMKRMSFDLARVARDGVEMLRPLADERGVKITCELNETPCLGDAEHLAQVVTNLLTNAVHYNKPGGEIRVNTQRQGALAVLSVTDNGVGISNEDLPRVFERFYRSDKSRSSGNAGLGLAICKAIVEAHGGAITVASEVGAGTTFRVHLPVA